MELRHRMMCNLVRMALVAVSMLSDLSAQASDALWAAFRNPPAEARPFVRWWWNGNRIDADDIRREVALLAAAGVGGVEINPIALPAEASPGGTEAVAWLTPEWNRLVRLAADEARAHGMSTDLIVGSGWPFGGRFLAPDEQIRILRQRTIAIPAGTARRFDAGELLSFEKARRGGDFVDDPATELEFLLLVPQRCASVDDVVDVTGEIAAGALLVEAAPADRRLFVGAVQCGFRLVVHGAPGADGPVLDHFDRRAVDKYLGNMSERLAPAMGGRLGDSLRAMFCDSIELGGADWTADLAAEFAARRGYALRPWLPFVAPANPDRPFGHLAADLELAPEFADQVRRARYDFARTLCELFEERFVRPFHEWCHAQGTLSRYQTRTECRGSTACSTAIWCRTSPRAICGSTSRTTVSGDGSTASATRCGTSTPPPRRT
ncbi:MAG: hypothetical protein IPM29_19970 [Planctomycetes bacterium]|nr:hypothetical protein [Planctomycetota bacterium]